MNKEENTFLKYLSDDLKPFADNTDCCTFIVRLRKENNEKDKEIERLNNIIDELEKTFVNDDKRIKEYNIEHPERPLDNYSRYYLDKLKKLKEGK